MYQKMSNKRNSTRKISTISKKIKLNLNSFNNYLLKAEEYGASKNCKVAQNICVKHPKRIIIENNVPQFAIKKENNDSLTNVNSEVVFLKGNWNTTNKRPTIVAEMHNVKLEELQGTWVGEGNDTFLVDAHDPLKLKAEQFNYPVASPRGSDSGLGNDSPEGNLSWLLNFKLDDIPGLPDCTTQATTTSSTSIGATAKKYVPRKSSEWQNKVSPIYIAEIIPKQYFDQHQVENVNVARIIREQSNSSGKNDSAAKPVSRLVGARKPPFTYTELIEHALREKGELTVSGIYQWISEHFSFYKSNDDRWKNSVRHNLSINPHFRKGNKAVHGAGHLWTIAQKDDAKNTSTWNAKRQRLQQFMQIAASEYQDQHEIELALATASILHEEQAYDGNEQQQHSVKMTEAQNQAQIHQTANDILGGIKREVEVQYIIPVGNTMDFLCPVSKEQVAAECGLSGEELQVTDNDYLITDLNPNTLGLNLSEAEVITADQLFSEDLNFQCYELSAE